MATSLASSVPDVPRQPGPGLCGLTNEIWLATPLYCRHYVYTNIIDPFTVITNYDAIGGKSEALIRINFMLGTFHQPESILHNFQN